MKKGADSTGKVMQGLMERPTEGWYSDNLRPGPFAYSVWLSSSARSI